MEQRKEWMSVPAFGEWDRHRGSGVPDYSVDFSKIREIRRRNRSQVSIGADEDLFSAPKDDAVSDSGLVSEGDPVGDINRPILQRPARARSPNACRDDSRPESYEVIMTGHQAGVKQWNTTWRFIP